MHRYFITFISGTEAIVARALRGRLADLRLLLLEDGAAAFETAVPYSDLNLFCCNNVFALLDRETLAPGGDVLDRFLARLLERDTGWPAAGENSGKIHSFRLVTSRENRLTPVAPGPRAALERRLVRETGLRPDRAAPDTEFWLPARRDGQCFFLKRLSRHRSYDRTLKQGELHPELAWMMCFLAAPRHTDAVLDPFCGSGAIPEQLCRHFPYRTLWASDLDSACVAATDRRLPRRESIHTLRLDARNLASTFAPESLDAVITDPPWGLYRSLDQPLDQFYREVLSALVPLLGPGGRLVWVTAGKEAFLSALGAFPALQLREEYGILVSGKKCGLYLAVKDEN